MYAKVRLPDVDALLFWQIHGVGFCDAVGFVPCVDVWHLAVHTPHAQLVWVALDAFADFLVADVLTPNVGLGEEETLLGSEAVDDGKGLLCELCLEGLV